MWIRLKNTPVFAFHGVYAHEREHGTRFEIDIEVFAQTAEATKNDSLGKTVDYVRLHRLITGHAQREHYNLLETWADRMVDETLKEFPQVEEVILRIRKPGAAIGGLLDTVEVECSKKR
jgi:dihydroneopterin aldolase